MATKPLLRWPAEGSVLRRIAPAHYRGLAGQIAVGDIAIVKEQRLHRATLVIPRIGLEEKFFSGEWYWEKVDG